MNRFLCLTVPCFLLVGLAAIAPAGTVTFEDITVPADGSLPAGATGGEMANPALGYTQNGLPVTPPSQSFDDGYGGTYYVSSFTDGGAQFTNSADVNPYYFDYAGWAVSSVAGVSWPSQSDYNNGGQVDYANQYQYTSFNGSNQTEGGGYGGSTNYAVVYDDGTPADSELTLPAGTSPVSMEVDATTYMALNAIYGDGFFPTGFVPGDSLTLNINGYDANNNLVTNNPVQVVMEDYPIGASGPSVMDQWTTVDLSSLAGAATLQFSFTAGSSSQSSSFGIENPTYFAADNLVVTPEPSSLVLVLIAGLFAVALAVRRRLQSA
ncbi:MAG TPA: DUF4465 domain-containing protein [Pirellulales bacterium]|nr:DUF4465 domain-containing protein [Pirellulales bacterium]